MPVLERFLSFSLQYGGANGDVEWLDFGIKN
jgi:hypothetical protein